MSTIDDRSGLARLIGRSLLTLAVVAVAAGLFALAALMLTDGIIGEFRIVVPVLAVFLLVTAIDWLHGYVATWLSGPDHSA